MSRALSALDMVIHNMLGHPLLVVGELVSHVGLERLAALFWLLHESTRGDLPRYEAWLQRTGRAE